MYINIKVRKYNDPFVYKIMYIYYAFLEYIFGCINVRFIIILYFNHMYNILCR